MHTSEIKICSIYFYVIISDANLCDDTHHLNAVLKTGSGATNAVFAGDLVPAGTVLVNPGVHPRTNHARPSV